MCDSENNLSDAFMTESKPSSPLSANKSPSSSDSSLGERRARLLTDIPLTFETQREHRSKFLNDASTPKEHNLSMRYQILARRTVKYPPPDVVPGLDVSPLKEHAWLDIRANAGVEVAVGFYDRLQDSVAHTHLLIIDLSDDNDSITNAMDEQESVY